MGVEYFFGSLTPWEMVVAMPVTLPSLHSQVPFVRLGARGEPVPADPWQPMHVAPDSPWNIRSPVATVSTLTPGGNTGWAVLELAAPEAVAVVAADAAVAGDDVAVTRTGCAGAVLLGQETICPCGLAPAL